MSRRERDVRRTAGRSEDWLGTERTKRGRTWAYEELLFGAADERERRRAIAALGSELVGERAELERMQEALLGQVRRIAALEERVQALASPAPVPPTPSGANGAGAPEPDPEPEPEPRADALSRRLASYPRTPPEAQERGLALARCEGFRVDSHSGTVGFVEGLRFASRIDRPDAIEVRGGRFGRQLFLIPVDRVEEVSRAEERVVVGSVPEPEADVVHDLVDRLRHAFHHPVQ